jgi:DNA-binding MarR family transcriptional regulator
MNAPAQINKEEFSQCWDCACFNVRKAARVVTQQYDESLQACGLRATQFPILVVIAWRGPTTLTDLAGELVMDRTTLTRNLKPLEALGLVQSVQGTDRRTHSVSLTPKGRKTLVKGLPLWKQAQAGILRAFGETRFSRLLGDLRLIEHMAGSKNQMGRGSA